MTTQSYSELVSAVRREGQALVAAAAQGVDEPVPTCEGWSVERLLRHVGRVYASTVATVGERRTSAPERPEVPDDVSMVDYVAHELDELVEALRSCDADTPVWNWSSEPQVAGFWARRMAHESAVHRFDAQRAHGVAQPVEADLAQDGLDELVDVILPYVVRRDDAVLPEATYAFATSGHGTWFVRLDTDGVHRLDTAKSPDVTVRGTTSALLLAAYNRVPWTSLETTGDTALLDAWTKALKF